MNTRFAEVIITAQINGNGSYTACRGVFVFLEEEPAVVAEVKLICGNTIGKLCVIGSKINEAAISALFGVE